MAGHATTRESVPPSAAELAVPAIKNTSENNKDVFLIGSLSDGMFVGLLVVGRFEGIDYIRCNVLADLFRGFLRG